MNTYRNRWMAAFTAAALLLGSAVAFADEPAAAEEAEEDEGVPAGASYSLEATGSYHHVDKPWFTTGSYHWFEGFARARGFYGFANGAHVTAGGVVTGTMDEDYYGTKDEQDGLLDQLALVVPSLGESGFGFSIGRQPLSLGDGFLVGDGYLDHRAALWNIPLSFYDAAAVTWAKGPHHVTAFAADFSPSFAGPDVETDGLILGGEFAWAPAEGSELALTLLRADVDFDDANSTPTAFSLRGKRAVGPWSFGTEVVLQGGEFDGVKAAGKGGHAEVEWAGTGRFKPTAKLQGLWFSGDDPDTDKDESYFPWQFTWNDWSNWYVGDLLASTVTTSSNMRIFLAQMGATLREGTGARVLVHQFALAEGDTKPFAWEVDVVVDQQLGERLSGYVMGAWAKPLDAAELLYGTEHATQVFAALTWKFSGQMAK